MHSDHTPKPGLLTAEQYGSLPVGERQTELVRGRVVELPAQTPLHWQVCVNIAGVLLDHVGPRQLGRVNIKDCAVVTARNPDTVRIADVAFWSSARPPATPTETGFGPPPELVFEVLSPSDRKAALTVKVGEYHLAGVLAVCVLDPDAGILAVYPSEELPRRYTLDEELTLPEVLPDFRVPVRRFLE